MIRVRSLVLVALALVSLPLFAQGSDLGLWISMPRFDSTELPDEEDPGAPPVELSFDEDLGYGVTYTHSFGGALALELGAQRMGGDVQFEFEGNELEVGEIDINAFTGTLQWRFAPGGRITPYVGAGLAYMTGEVELVPTDEPTEDDEVELDSETTWLANAGIIFNLSDRLAIGADVKYIPYDPTDEGGDESDAVDINPLVFSAGLRIRFGR